MKTAGTIRRIDDFGQVFVPNNMLQIMGIKPGDQLEFLFDGEKMILRKYQPCCYICGSHDDLQPFHGRPICIPCVKQATGLQGK